MGGVEEGKSHRGLQKMSNTKEHRLEKNNRYAKNVKKKHVLVEEKNRH